MANKKQPSKSKIILRWAGFSAFGLSILNAVLLIFGTWAINAPHFGAHDMGLALALAFGGSVNLLVALVATPIFIVLALIAAFVCREAVLWFAAAGVVSAITFLSH
jgi:hypothetical protein